MDRNIWNTLSGAFNDRYCEEAYIRGLMKEDEAVAWEHMWAHSLKNYTTGDKTYCFKDLSDKRQEAKKRYYFGMYTPKDGMFNL